MKTKALKQSLSLKKQTISNLNSIEMNIVKGGTEDTSSGCPTVCVSCVICIRTNNDTVCIPTR